MKLCSSCKIEKKLAEFSKRIRAKDGRDYYCRECKKRKMDPIKHSRLNKVWREANRVRDSLRRKARREQGPESWNARSRKWRQENPHLDAARASARRAVARQAKPSWADRAAIAAIYAEARRLSQETGILHHVDHSVPLKSPIVCGLHWEANLQILPSAENVAKHNRRWPDMLDLEAT